MLVLLVRTDLTTAPVGSSAGTVIVSSLRSLLGTMTLKPLCVVLDLLPCGIDRLKHLLTSISVTKKV